jgi:ATP adenylyltransferase
LKKKSPSSKKPSAEATAGKPSKRMKMLEAIAKDIWPNERDFFERPERLRYVRKLLPENGCVFCNAAKGGVGFDNLCLYADEKVLIVLNKFPYNTGHLLILPRRHIADLWDLSKEENAELAGWIQTALKKLKNVYKCDGFNIGLNHGSVAGAGIPQHLHWHIVPRWSGDTNFFPLIAETKALPETLEQTYNKLKESFQ